MDGFSVAQKRYYKRILLPVIETHLKSGATVLDLGGGTGL